MCCTSGDQGGEDPDADPLELAALREAEQRAAAAIVGYAGVTFLHQPDGALANDLPLREQLVREIRTFRPDAVLATDPETLFYKGGGINHTDHRAAGLAAVDAVYPAARNPMAFPSLARSGLAAHRVRRLYLFWSERSRHVGRRVGHARPQDRRAARARQPDPRPGRPRRRGSASWAAEEGEPIGVGGRGGAPPDRHRRRRGRGPGLSRRSSAGRGQASSSRSGRIRAPLVPQLGQAVGAPAEHRRPSRPASGRRRRPARYSSAATRTSLNRTRLAASFGQWRTRIGSRPA